MQDHVRDGGQGQQAAGWDHGVSDRSMSHKRDVNVVTVVLLCFFINPFFQQMKQVHKFEEGLRLRLGTVTEPLQSFIITHVLYETDEFFHVNIVPLLIFDAALHNSQLLKRLSVKEVL